MFGYICTKLFPTLISKREYRRKFKDVQQKVRFFSEKYLWKQKYFGKYANLNFQTVPYITLNDMLIFHNFSSSAHTCFQMTIIFSEI